MFTLFSGLQGTSKFCTATSIMSTLPLSLPCYYHRRHFRLAAGPSISFNG
ncbi:hypothetical protein FOCG_07510 [Fusarium oxysporum f. sp. radicis-lycopersici 26381]|nr:hypothetical protein FOCG_07510 [Fusarium oxysporum f. sp. radicis-lycopersici 26381]